MTSPSPTATGTATWRIAGEYLENCNCAVLCPCLLGPRDARGGALERPTEGHCDVPVVFSIEQGRWGPMDLGGLRAALAVYTPGPMAEGGWTVGVYVDAAASGEQRRALEAIFAGRAGGVLGRLDPLIARRFPTRVVPITFGKDGRRRWASIPDVLDVEIEGIAGADGTETWIDNVRHFVSRRLAAARATRGVYRDHGLHWDNRGRNGHYAAFDWSGP